MWLKTPSFYVIFFVAGATLALPLQSLNARSASHDREIQYSSPLYTRSSSPSGSAPVLGDKRKAASRKTGPSPKRQASLTTVAPADSILPLNNALPGPAQPVVATPEPALPSVATSASVATRDSPELLHMLQMAYSTSPATPDGPRCPLFDVCKTDKPFSNKGTLKTHLLEQHINDKRECLGCGKALLRLSYLENHRCADPESLLRRAPKPKEIQVPDEEDPTKTKTKYQCEVVEPDGKPCNKLYTVAKSCRDHWEKYHQGREPIFCKYGCGASFSGKSSATRHEKLKRCKNPGPRPLVLQHVDKGPL